MGERGGSNGKEKGLSKENVFDISDWQKPDVETGPSAAPSLASGVVEERLRKLPREEKLRIIQDEYTTWSKKWTEMIDGDVLSDINAVDKAVDHIAVLWVQANNLLPGEEVIDRAPYEAIRSARERYRQRHAYKE